jgi:N-acetyl-anhydromuramyl-L-alanine amidase AmpD
MAIHKLLTTVNFSKPSGKKNNKYIVIHFVGALGGAEQNCKYFQKEYRGASAHYFVGHEGEIWQCVADANVAWHCGSSSGYKHKDCRNSNSIGIEMCCRKDSSGKWYFEEETVKATIKLTKTLMKNYNIPVENVIRHYDVTGKNCPAPYVLNNTKHKWDNFLKELQKTTTTTNNSSTTKGENSMPKLDNTPDTYAKEAIEWAKKKGYLKGNDKGDLMLHSNITRQDLYVILYRLHG